MKKKWITGLTAALFIAGFGISAIAAENPPDALLMNACTKCHNSKKICNNLGKKDEAAWKSTIQRMVKKGAALSSAQQDAIRLYLFKLAPNSEPVCPKGK